jgi:hypothetical protein
MFPRLKMIAAIGLSLAIPRGITAHPISLPSAIVNVQPDHVQVELVVMLEDLVLFYKIQAGKDFYFPAAPIHKAAVSHRQFLLDGLFLVDDHGNRLTGAIEEPDLGAIPEKGALQSELKARTICYQIRYPTDHATSLLTVSQQFGGEKAILPAQLDLVVLQQGVLLSRSRQLPANRPASYRIDWKKPPRQTLTLEDIRRQKQEQFRQRLGISSYSGLYSFIYITGREVRHEILIPLLTLETWLTIPRADADFLTVQEQQAARQQIGDYFLNRNPVQVNGQASSPVLTRLNFFGLDIRDFALNAEPRKVSVYQARVGIIMTYPCPRSPREVTFLWESFNPHATFLRSTVFALNEPVRQQTFVKEKPEFTWHAAKGADISPPARPVMLGINKNRTIRPDTRQARSITTSLLENIYHSFDLSTDAQVYDAMATSIDGPLLRQLFLQTKRSLVIAEQGGAIARVAAVESLEGKLLVPGKESFQYLAQWRVTGTVEHWGHIHMRENQYEALLTVNSTTAGWKISGYQLRDQKGVRMETTIRGYDPIPDRNGARNR